MKIDECIQELIQELAPDQGASPSRAFSLVLSLQAGYASRPVIENCSLCTRPAPDINELQAKAVVLDYLLSPNITGQTAKARLVEYRSGILQIHTEKGQQS